MEGGREEWVYSTYGFCSGQNEVGIGIHELGVAGMMM